MTETPTCPKCESENVKLNHYYDYKKEIKKIEFYKCWGCGHIFETKEEVKCQEK